MKKKLKFIILPVIAFALFFLARLMEAYPDFVERFYSTKINKRIIQGISRVTGIVDYSIGEFIYIGHVIAVPIVMIILIYKIIKSCRDHKTLNFLLNFMRKIISYLSIVYIVFMLIWGLNYSRTSIKDTLNLHVELSSTDDLYKLNEALILKANNLRTQVEEDKNGVMRVNGGYQSIFERAHLGYDQVHVDALSGSYGKPKPYALSKVLLYTQITGLYFPFTAEPNVNTSIPDIVFPATTLHEMAHQRGYASEEEANYIAYLTSSHHPDIDFQYSGTVFALIYTMNALRSFDKEGAEELEALFGDGLQRDLKHYNEFWDDYDGLVKQLSFGVNDAFLKANRQDEGIKSYGEMVDLLLAHYKKHGEV